MVITIPRSLALAAFILAPILVTAPAAALQCAAGSIAFHPDGGIKSCEIDANHRLWTDKGYAVDCVAGATVTQHPGGALESCRIGQAHDFGPRRCEAPGQVVFSADGSLRDCRPE